jgi:hypothetical protein
VIRCLWAEGVRGAEMRRILLAKNRDSVLSQQSVDEGTDMFKVAEHASLTEIDQGSRPQV